MSDQDPHEVHLDLGPSIALRGGPEDRELLEAANGGDYLTVRRILLAAPYELDPRLVDQIVGDLRIGRALP